VSLHGSAILSFICTTFDGTWNILISPVVDDHVTGQVTRHACSVVAVKIWTGVTFLGGNIPLVVTKR